MRNPTTALCAITVIALATAGDALDSFSAVAARAGFRHVNATLAPLGAVLTEDRQA